MRDPSPAGGGVSHSIDLMFAYHWGVFPGSETNAETSATGRAIQILTVTSSMESSSPFVY